MRKNRTIIIISVALIAIALTVSIFFENDLMNKVIEVVTLVTAIIGAVALFIQFKKDKDLNEANFVMEFSKAFFNEYNCGDFFTKLDATYNNPSISWEIDLERDREYIVRYLLWIESISAVIMDGVMDVSHIDKALGYRFFILVNNKIIQDSEIVPYKEDYAGTYMLYDVWYNYRKKKGITIPLEDSSLHLTEGYEENRKRSFM